jgi:hypothetical protein
MKLNIIYKKYLTDGAGDGHGFGIGFRTGKGVGHGYDNKKIRDYEVSEI